MIGTAADDDDDVVVLLVIVVGVSVYVVAVDKAGKESLAEGC